MLKLKQALSTSSFALCLVGSLVGSVTFTDDADAAPVTTLSNATSHPMSPVNVFGSSATNESGMTFTSTYSYSVFGYTGGYGLSTNGSWTGANGPYIGLNSASGYLTITFDEAVASFLAFVNYAPGSLAPYIAAFDIDNQLIESLNLSISTPSATNAGATIGFSEGSNSIKSVRFGNDYIVASNIVTGQAVPLPNTGLLMAIGFGTLAIALRRRGPQAAMPATVAA